VTSQDERPSAAFLRAAALRSARLNGCNCDPEVEVRYHEQTGGRTSDALIRHDAWCALLHRIDAPSN
jgi:hypothetical protein